MMMNRWQGNSGRVQRIRESPAPSPPRQRQEAAVARQASAPAPRVPSHRGRTQSGQSFSLDGLKKLLPSRLDELETEDIILLLILYLMYRESGDSELLMIMGAMFLL